ncbi:hypothetical protein OS493_012322 [Desmophyllum pertusum]|uniref:Uncharacterized protein n=1 Tax=Desmophyllum pertusum TaxID=174260 RepID=A0A9W9ZU28_9CNID|nr:hypothetical protein OS493_012322 [Desmophyllum pertusum]
MKTRMTIVSHYGCPCVKDCTYTLCWLIQRECQVVAVCINGKYPKSPSLAYAAKAVTRNVLFAVDILYPVLKAWHSFLMKEPSQKVKPSASDQGPSTAAINLEEAEPYSYTDLLEFSIPGQTVSPTELKREVDLMKDEFEEWKTKYNNFELELKNLYEEMQKELEKDKTIENLQSINQDLLNYIDMLEKNENVSYKGKDISEVKKKSRTLKTFSSKAQNALWFAKSFGLEFKSMVVAETKTGELHTVESTAQAQADGHEESHGFDALSDEEKQM